MSGRFHRVHNYLIGDAFARGRFASVRLCFDPKCQKEKTFCAKMINKNLQNKEETSRIVFNERTLAPLLAHPNILAVSEVFDTSKTLFQISKFYQKGNLLQFIRTCESISMSQKLQIASDILSAIYFLHTHYIIHRDIKLENILITDNMHAKLCDFGLASVAFSKGHVSGKCGSYHYIAPEVIRMDDNTMYDGFAADMWSLGVLLFALFTHTLPYPNLENNFSSFDYDDPNFDLLPERVRGVIRRLLSKDPLQRPTIQKVVTDTAFGPIHLTPSSTFFDRIDQPLEEFDTFAESRVAQIMATSITECETKLKESGPNMEKLLYYLLLERFDKYSNYGLNTITMCGSCPNSLGRNLLMKSYRAKSCDIMKYIQDYVIAQNGCITEPTTANRQIVLNMPQNDVILSFDCFDIDDACDLMITENDVAEEIMCGLALKFQEIE